MRQPVLVGEMNPYGANPDYALFCHPPNSAGGRLQQHILAMPRHLYLGLPRHNLCSVKWTLSTARAAADSLRLRYSSEAYGFVLLGSKVCSAFRVPFEPFTVQQLDGRSVVVLPHPSGRCRLWNEPRAHERARETVRAVFPAVPLCTLDRRPS